MHPFCHADPDLRKLVECHRLIRFSCHDDIDGASDVCENLANVTNDTTKPLSVERDGVDYTNDSVLDATEGAIILDVAEAEGKNDMLNSKELKKCGDDESQLCRYIGATNPEEGGTDYEGTHSSEAHASDSKHRNDLEKGLIGKSSSRFLPTADLVRIAPSKLPFAGEGLFARRFIPANTIIGKYDGDYSVDGREFDGEYTWSVKRRTVSCNHLCVLRKQYATKRRDLEKQYAPKTWKRVSPLARSLPRCIFDVSTCVPNLLRVMIVWFLFYPLWLLINTWRDFVRFVVFEGILPVVRGFLCCICLKLKRHYCHGNGGDCCCESTLLGCSSGYQGLYKRVTIWDILFVLLGDLGCPVILYPCGWCCAIWNWCCCPSSITATQDQEFPGEECKSIEPTKANFGKSLPAGAGPDASPNSPQVASGVSAHGTCTYLESTIPDWFFSFSRWQFLPEKAHPFTPWICVNGKDYMGSVNNGKPLNYLRYVSGARTSKQHKMINVEMLQTNPIRDDVWKALQRRANDTSLRNNFTSGQNNVTNGENDVTTGQNIRRRILSEKAKTLLLNVYLTLKSWLCATPNVYYISTRDIGEGEEFIIDYGQSYWTAERFRNVPMVD